MRPIPPALKAIALPGGIVAVLVLAALFGPLLLPFDPLAMDVPHRFASMGWPHVLGTDQFGRDVFTRLVYGARASLSVAFISALVAAAIGVTLGLVGAYFRGLAEVLTLRMMDVVLCFPPVLLALLVVTLFGTGAVTLTVVLALLFVPGFCRVTFGEVARARRQDYVQASLSLGARVPRVLFMTILPNVLGPVLTQFSLTIASAVMLESGLSFLGVGVAPPAASWGLMIRDARAYMDTYPSALVWPCLALILTVWPINRLCDALRMQFDPRRSRVVRGAVVANRHQSTAMPPQPSDLVLTVRNLKVDILAGDGRSRRVVDGVDFDVRRGEILAVVGESGSGKSMTAFALMGLLPAAGAVVEGTLGFRPDPAVMPLDLAHLSDTQLRGVRGRQIAMVFQEPMTSLNPVLRIGEQVAEAIRAHAPRLPRAQLRARVDTLLSQVGIADPARVQRSFPHELSGGMRQRVVIAMALSCDPVLLLADEPTTALDATVQAQILDLLKEIQRNSHGRLSVILVTHDLAVVSEIADRVLVMYRGRVVESGDTVAVFTAPRDPYTQRLLHTLPGMAEQIELDNHSALHDAGALAS